MGVIWIVRSIKDIPHLLDNPYGAKPRGTDQPISDEPVPSAPRAIQHSFQRCRRRPGDDLAMASAFPMLMVYLMITGLRDYVGICPPLWECISASGRASALPNGMTRINR